MNEKYDEVVNNNSVLNNTEINEGFETLEQNNAEMAKGIEVLKSYLVEKDKIIQELSLIIGEKNSSKREKKEIFLENEGLGERINGQTSSPIKDFDDYSDKELQNDFIELEDVIKEVKYLKEDNKMLEVKCDDLSKKVTEITEVLDCKIAENQKLNNEIRELTDEMKLSKEKSQKEFMSQNNVIDELKTCNTTLSQNLSEISNLTKEYIEKDTAGKENTAEIRVESFQRMKEIINNNIDEISTNLELIENDEEESKESVSISYFEDSYKPAAIRRINSVMEIILPYIDEAKRQSEKLTYIDKIREGKIENKERILELNSSISYPVNSNKAKNNIMKMIENLDKYKLINSEYEMLKEKFEETNRDIEILYQTTQKEKQNIEIKNEFLSKILNFNNGLNEDVADLKKSEFKRKEIISGQVEKIESLEKRIESEEKSIKNIKKEKKLSDSIFPKLI